MPGPLYQKFGARVADPSEGLQAGLNNQTSALKDALGGVQSLLDKKIASSTQENTLNMQEYLKKNIKSGGLGADPTDKVAIKQKFGNLINMEDVDKTIASTTGEMKTEAIDTASGVAGQVFGQTEDLAAAGNSIKQSLIQAGMGETEATKEAQTWRNDNQFLAEDIKVRDTKLIDDASTALLQRMKEGGDRGETINEFVQGMPPKLQMRAKEEFNNKVMQWDKLRPDQQAQVDTAYARVDSDRAAAEDLINQQLAQGKAAFDAIEVVDQGAYAGVDGMSAQLGGTVEQMGQDAQNGFFAGIYRGFGNLVDDNQMTGDEAAVYIKNKADSTIGKSNYDVSLRDRAAIALQVYNDLKTEGGLGGFGKAMYKKAIDEKMNVYLGLHEAKQKQLANYTAMQKQATNRLKQLNDRAITIKADMLKGEVDSNYTNKAFDPNEMFKNQIRTSTTLPGSPPETKPKSLQPDKNKPETEVSKNQRIIDQAAAADAAALAAAGGTPPPGGGLPQPPPVSGKKESASEFRARIQTEGLLPIAANAVGKHLKKSYKESPGFW